MKRSLFLLCLITLITSCSSNKTIDVKSPCVSKEDGPCGPKKSINDWWLKNNV